MLGKSCLSFIVVNMFITLWITHAAWAWGALGHRIIAENGSALVADSLKKNCRITDLNLTEHTNDPDKIWRQQRFLHPHEAVVHFFHVDRQPPDWRTRSDAKDRTQGVLVYRIVDWVAEAKALRKK